MEFSSLLYLNGRVDEGEGAGEGREGDLNKGGEKERKERGDQASTLSIQDPTHSAPPCLTPPPTHTDTHWNQSLWFYSFSSCSSSPCCVHCCRRQTEVQRSCWPLLSGAGLQHNNGSRRLQMNAPGKSVMELKGMRLGGIQWLIKEL